MYLDIEKIKREVSMAQILDYYGIELKKKGKQGLYGSCPIHNGDNQNAFHVDLGKNLFHCFTHCGGGSIIDFVMKKEQLSFYKAALKIWRTFFGNSKKCLRFNSNSNSNSNADSLINIEIDIEVHHPYLIRRGIDEKLASFFQIRYYSYGRMRDRIVFPIMDRYKKQVGCCGRVVHPGILPKYLFSKDFKKSFHLYNIQNIVPHSRMPVVIVEGFFDCIHVMVNGFDCVALMGNSISTYQLELLKEMERNYILMLDGDDAGRKATQRVGKQMEQNGLSFRVVHLSNNLEPEALGYDELSKYVRQGN
jgi:DNA primase